MRRDTELSQERAKERLRLACFGYNGGSLFPILTVIDSKIVTLGGHLSPGTITSIKVVIMIGVIEDSVTNLFITSNSFECNEGCSPHHNEVNFFLSEALCSLIKFSQCPFKLRNSQLFEIRRR